MPPSIASIASPMLISCPSEFSGTLLGFDDFVSASLFFNFTPPWFMLTFLVDMVLEDVTE